MNGARLLATAVAAVSAAAMAYVGLYQVRAVERMICPLVGRGCERVADAPFARPFGLPEPVWALFAHAVELMGPKPTLIEWDAKIPPWPVLRAQAEEAEHVMAAFHPLEVPRVAVG